MYSAEYSILADYTTGLKNAHYPGPPCQMHYTHPQYFGQYYSVVYFTLPHSAV